MRPDTVALDLCCRAAIAGVFFSVNGLNYKAILDTASDVAKAMVHLHLANVLHSDLKVRGKMGVARHPAQHQPSWIYSSRSPLFCAGKEHHA